MKTVSVEPDDVGSQEDVEISDVLLEAVEEEMEYLEGRGLNQVRMRCRRNSDEVYQATIHAGDEMYRLSEVGPGNVSRTVFRNPERKGDENLVGAPSELEDDEEAGDAAPDDVDEEAEDAGDDEDEDGGEGTDEDVDDTGEDEVSDDGEADGAEAEEDGDGDEGETKEGESDDSSAEGDETEDDGGDDEEDSGDGGDEDGDKAGDR